MCGEKIDYAKFSSAQDTSVPLFENSNTNKTALLIFPHPDDEIVCGGTIVYLKKNGWSVNLLTFTQGNGDEKVARSQEWAKAVKVLKLDDAQLLDLPNNPWDSVLSNGIEFWYEHQDSVENIIDTKIQQYNPSLLITYDTALGAYGHPEHRIAALAAYNVFKEHQTDSTFSVSRILQITLPENIGQLELGGAVPYKNAIQRTGNKTLPDPTVAFDISNYWPTKRASALQYESQAGTLRKFFLLPATEDTIEHYRAFSREYYFEIKR